MLKLIDLNMLLNMSPRTQIEREFSILDPLYM
jgi:hypothetical protein